MTLRRTNAVSLLLACLGALGCDDAAAPAQVTYAYTISFSDGDSRNYAGTDGGFTSYNATEPPNELWVAEYFLGDSIEVFEFLPTDAHCPEPRKLTLSGAALGGTELASVAVRHTKLQYAIPVADSSSFTVDSMTEGRVWGHFVIELVPESAGEVGASIVGSVSLPEVDGVGFTPHCG
jgi:hypothetical protein